MKQLMLVGDSMIEFFDWQERFPGYEVLNLGRSGESVEELRLRAANIVERFAPPDLVLVMIGTNNVAMERFDFLSAYGDIITTFHEAYPETKLVVNSLLPMNLRYLAPDTVARVNVYLAELAARFGVAYLNAWRKMVDREGFPLSGVLEDEVHLTRTGYKIWSADLEEFLATCL